MRKARLTDEVLIHGLLARAADDLLGAVGLPLVDHLLASAALLDEADVLSLAPPNLLADVCAVPQRIEIVLEIGRREVTLHQRTFLGRQELPRACERVDQCHKGLVLQENRLGRIHHGKAACAVEIKEHRPERCIILRALVHENLHRMQTIEC